MRPGYLSGFQGITPRAFSEIPYLGAFGKGFIAPPPGAPSPDTQGQEVYEAISKSSGDFYRQDPKCKEIGQKWQKITYKCKDLDECCDDPKNPGTCDPVGTQYTEDACDDDPDYVELAPPPDTGFKSCKEWEEAGYPKDRCNETICPSCFQKPQKKQSKPQKQAAPARPKGPVRPPGSVAFKGGCPKTHFKSKDELGDFCRPCPQNQLFHEGKCRPKPPPCECNLPRTGDPNFGPCPPAPRNCGPAPGHQKCLVKGYGPANLVCRCGKWVCPKMKDILMASRARRGKGPPGFGSYFGEGAKKALGVSGLVAVAIVAWLLLRK
jgi:hypothetical protein